MVGARKVDAISGGIALQQRVQAAGLVQRIQIVEAADVGIAHVDLRHGAAAGAFAS